MVRRRPLGSPGTGNAPLLPSLARQFLVLGADHRPAPVGRGQVDDQGGALGKVGRDLAVRQPVRRDSSSRASARGRYPSCSGAAPRRSAPPSGSWPTRGRRRWRGPRVWAGARPPSARCPRRARSPSGPTPGDARAASGPARRACAGRSRAGTTSDSCPAGRRSRSSR